MDRPRAGRERKYTMTQYTMTLIHYDTAILTQAQTYPGPESMFKYRVQSMPVRVCVVTLTSCIISDHDDVTN